ncbi:uncharacterized protein CIMG_12942 [Coccidioides immitis RS]|uniref:Uncharacterized protein n=1 Tax=Coccidioides immitis (strain RS) TaxID=246410 RepID=J3K3A0_COCIM|nr:uncharacterized protein CIMG_12942 [Coccidioides immitis RS]EAS28638.3 hypothetical protein CIMG_12942 [Coccidioides immitis RS]
MELNTDSHIIRKRIKSTAKYNTLIKQPAGSLKSRQSRGASSMSQNNMMQEAMDLIKNNDINILFEKSQKHCNSRKYSKYISQCPATCFKVEIIESIWTRVVQIWYDGRYNVSSISSTLSNKPNKTEARRLYNIASFAWGHFMKKTCDVVMRKLSGLTAKE